jgi:hypothetical protein
LAYAHPSTAAVALTLARDDAAKPVLRGAAKDVRGLRVPFLVKVVGALKERSGGAVEKKLLPFTSVKANEIKRANTDAFQIVKWGCSNGTHKATSVAEI